MKKTVVRQRSGRGVLGQTADLVVKSKHRAPMCVECIRYSTLQSVELRTAFLSLFEIKEKIASKEAGAVGQPTQRTVE